MIVHLLGQLGPGGIVGKRRNGLGKFGFRQRQIFHTQCGEHAVFPLVGEPGHGVPRTLMAAVQIQHPTVAGDDARQALVRVLVQRLGCAPGLLELRVLRHPGCRQGLSDELGLLHHDIGTPAHQGQGQQHGGRLPAETPLLTPPRV